MQGNIRKRPLADQDSSNKAKRIKSITEELSDKVDLIKSITEKKFTKKYSERENPSLPSGYHQKRLTELLKLQETVKASGKDQTEEEAADKWDQDVIDFLQEAILHLPKDMQHLVNRHAKSEEDEETVSTEASSTASSEEQNTGDPEC
eukprot:scaffold52252_cov35-Cyclotella_meneghiniana.AAC.6